MSCECENKRLMSELGRVRRLAKAMAKAEGRTYAIPTGTYRVTLGIKSHKYSNFSKYPWAEKWGGFLPRLIAVPKREGILIHVGNTAPADTQGCILVGENKIVGRVINSVATMNNLLYPLLKGKREIEITVE